MKNLWNNAKNEKGEKGQEREEGGKVESSVGLWEVRELGRRWVLGYAKYSRGASFAATVCSLFERAAPSRLCFHREKNRRRQTRNSISINSGSNIQSTTAAPANTQRYSQKGLYMWYPRVLVVVVVAYDRYSIYSIHRGFRLFYIRQNQDIKKSMRNSWLPVAQREHAQGRAA